MALILFFLHIRMFILVDDNIAQHTPTPPCGRVIYAHPGDLCSSSQENYTFLPRLNWGGSGCLFWAEILRTIVWSRHFLFPLNYDMMLQIEAALSAGPEQKLFGVDCCWSVMDNWYKWETNICCYKSLRFGSCRSS